MPRTAFQMDCDEIRVCESTIPSGGTTCELPKAVHILPAEIEDKIIDHVAALFHSPSGNKPSSPQISRELHSCTLVCRRWLPRSSKYLLECVDLSRKSSGQDTLGTFLCKRKHRNVWHSTSSA